MDKVYIVQCHEENGISADGVEVFRTLAEAASSYNMSIQTTGEIYGDDDCNSSCLSDGEVKSCEGKNITKEYEVTDGGATHIISLYTKAL